MEITKEKFKELSDKKGAVKASRPAFTTLHEQGFWHHGNFYFKSGNGHHRIKSKKSDCYIYL